MQPDKVMCSEELDDDVPCPNEGEPCSRCKTPVCWSHDVTLWRPLVGSSSVEDMPVCRSCAQRIMELLSAHVSDLAAELRAHGVKAPKFEVEWAD